MPTMAVKCLRFLTDSNLLHQITPEKELVARNYLHYESLASAAVRIRTRGTAAGLLET